MSELLDKSKDNLKSADILIKKFSIYSSSIHCSYYSSLQIIIHILFNSDLSSKWEEYKKQLSKNKTTNTDEQGLHNSYINFIKHQLLSNPNLYDDLRDFGTKIESLKIARVDSDYKEINITPKRANDSLERAISLNKLLKSNFKL